MRNSRKENKTFHLFLLRKIKSTKENPFASPSLPRGSKTAAWVKGKLPLNCYYTILLFIFYSRQKNKSWEIKVLTPERDLTLGGRGKEEIFHIVIKFSSMWAHEKSFIQLFIKAYSKSIVVATLIIIRKKENI